MRHAVQLDHPDESNRSALALLGISPSDATAVGLTMLEAVSSADPLGASTEPGFMLWTRGLSALGQVLGPRGWKRTRIDGVEMVVSPSGKLAISINSGDEHVGNLSIPPSARYPRGRAVARHVQSNELLQYEAFPDIAPAAPAPVHYEHELWFLLHRYADNQLKMELVLVTGLDDDRRGLRYIHRIQLGTFGFVDDELDGGLSGPIITITPR